MFADPPRPSQIIAEALQSGELSIDDVTPTREPIDDVDINISSSIDVLTGSMKELSMLPIPPTQQLHRNNNIEDNNNNNDKDDVSADVSRHDDDEDDEEDEDEDEDEKDGIEKRKGRDVSRCLCYHHHHHHRSFH